MLQLRSRAGVGMIQSSAVKGNPTVLVVEDDPDLRETMAMLLKHSGYQVTTANNGREALDLLRSTPHPGVMLLDLRMPVMDGWELAAIMAEDRTLSGIPIIVASASDPAPTQGVMKVFRKPLDLQVLLNLLHTFFAQGP